MYLKLLPYTSRKVLPIASASQITFTPGTRAAKPYPPGKVQVNGEYWPDGTTFSGDVTLTWAHRNKYAQSAREIVHQDAASVAAGVLGSYKVEVLINDAVVRTTTGLTGTSYLYTLAQCTSDGGAGQWIKLRITPVFSEVEGPARTTDQFKMS
jgi:hypothetical protein